MGQRGMGWAEISAWLFFFFTLQLMCTVYCNVSWCACTGFRMCRRFEAFSKQLFISSLHPACHSSHDQAVSVLCLLERQITSPECTVVTSTGVIQERDPCPVHAADRRLSTSVTRAQRFPPHWRPDILGFVEDTDVSFQAEPHSGVKGGHVCLHSGQNNSPHT